MTTATKLTLDREIVEQFIIEVDGLATFDSMLHGRNETWLEQHIYGLLDGFEKATLGSLSDAEVGKLHEQGIERGRELAREFFASLFERSDDA